MKIYLSTMELSIRIINRFLSGVEGQFRSDTALRQNRHSCESRNLL